MCFKLKLYVTHWQWPLALSGIGNVHIIVKLYPLSRTFGYILQWGVSSFYICFSSTNAGHIVPQLQQLYIVING
jgi:hypothetical protein